MQPMYRPQMNIEIAKQFKTTEQFSINPPATPSKMTVLDTQAVISVVMDDQRAFEASYLNKVPDNSSADFMLRRDCSTSRTNHRKLDARVKSCPGGLGMFSKCIE